MCGSAGYRLRQAELMYQVEGQQQGASRLLRSIIRRNPNFAGNKPLLCPVHWSLHRLINFPVQPEG